MVDLQKISGLPLFFDKKRQDLVFNNGDFPFVEKSERTLNELRPYLRNPEVAKGSNPVYRVWRRAHLRQDDGKVKQSQLRYDLTLIPPGQIGDEFVKTAGHYHKNKNGLGVSYPEIYEVLRGRAYFFIQRPGKDFKNIESAILVEAGPGEKFLIPPSYGHNTINVFDEPLFLANWVSDSAEYDYEPYKSLGGASYHFLAEGNLIDIMKNPASVSVSEIKKMCPKEYSEFDLVKEKPLYSLVNNLEKLKFLNHPEEFKKELEF